MTEPAGAPAPPTPGGGSPARRYRSAVVSLAASGLLLAFVYSRLEVRLIAEALLRADRAWLIVSIALILPITVLRAARFLWVAPAGALPGIVEALRLTLVASALNLFAPAKAGDLVKGYFVARRSDTSAGVSMALVIYERLCDLFALIFWCVLGWAIARPPAAALTAPFWILLGVTGAVCALLVLSASVAALVRVAVARARPRGRLRALLALAEGWPDLLHLLGRRRAWIVLISLGLWLAHLSQIWLFTVALGVEVPFFACASLSAVALMAGQMPFTLAGIGARDLALVLLMAPYMPSESAAALGILIVTRGVVPAVLGVPLTWPYLSSLLRDVGRWRRAPDSGSTSGAPR